VKRAALLGALGVLALIAQGALARAIPPPFCPDFAFLVVVGIGSCWRGLSSGLVLSAMLGYTADLYSGSLLGQTALLRVVAFASALLASRQLNLRGGLPLMLFTAALTVACGLLSQGLSSAFVGVSPLGLDGFAALLVHAVANAIAAPAVLALVRRVAAWAGDEAGGRPLHVDPLGRAV
jgi:cell shape-determining protein MreD